MFTSFVALLWLWSAVSCQEHSSVSQTTRPDSCNVVCNCGLNENPLQTSEGSRHPGVPGKRGQKGEIGPIGPKGQKGFQGAKGQKGKDADSKLMSGILRALSAKSCGELADQHGITISGYYLMKSTTGNPAYTYCDFQVYSDSVSCEELQTSHSITRAGYYRFGGSSNNFRFCQPIFRDIFTCERLRSRYGVNESGFQYFSLGELKPFKVYCNFTSGTAVTEVHHNLMKEMQIRDCEDPGCYVGMPLYDVEPADIRRIIDNSVSCKQFIKLRCRGVLINYNNVPRAYWNSHSGEKMRYWGGSRRNGYCACGETNSCIGKSHKCNCDNNSGDIVTSDEGYLDDKTKLPLKEIRVGDMGSWDEIAWHTIGQLECTGQV